MSGLPTTPRLGLRSKLLVCLVVFVGGTSLLWAPPASAQALCRDGSISHAEGEDACADNGGAHERVDPAGSTVSAPTTKPAWLEVIFDNPWVFWVFSALIISLVTVNVGTRSG